MLNYIKVTRGAKIGSNHFLEKMIGNNKNKEIKNTKRKQRINEKIKCQILKETKFQSTRELKRNKIISGTICWMEEQREEVQK